MKKTRMLTALLLAVALLCTAVLAFAENAPCMYIDGRNARKVHLRQEPSTKSKSLGLFYTGTPVIPLSSPTTGWFQVRIGDETGYVSATYLNAVCPESKAPLAVMNNPNSNWAHLRSGASRQSQSIGRLYNDDIVYVLGELNSGWTYVQSGDQMGYVVSSFVKNNTTTSAASPAARDTRRLITAPKLQMVGVTPQSEMIYALTAPTNGQVLYFVSQTKDPAVYWDDVNFDGRDDLVVTTATGTSNQFFAFFVFNGAGYTPVQVSAMEHDLSNYQLIPKQKMVVSYSNNGSAGACHEYILFRWEGAGLKVARRAVSDVLVDRYRQDGLSITATNDKMFKITVTDYASGFFGDSVIFQTIVSNNEINTAMSQEQAALWKGLK